MNTQHSTNRKFNRMFANILSIVVILAMAFPATGSVYAVELSPFLRAFPDGNAVDGGDWPLGANVHMTIDDPETEDDPDYVDDATVVASEEWWISTYVSFEFDGLYDLKRGDEVTLSTDGIVRYLVVPEVWVTTIDPAANIVGGTFEGADVGTTVHVFIGGGAELYVPTESGGAWIADFDDVGFDLLPGMQGAVEVWFDEFNDSSTFNWSVPQVSWRDEFDGSLAGDWYWVNENPDEWNLTENPGYLRIYTSPYSTGGENLLLRSVVQGDFVIKTRVLFEPDTNFQIAGLVIWQDDQNFLQFGRAFCDPWCVGNAIYFDKILDGNLVDGNFGTQVNSANEAYMRLERRGEMVKAFYGFDGFTWYEMGTHWIPSDFKVNAVGLTASQDYSDVGVPADFDFFELTEGWGFLPEGFHDYDSGDVPSWACNAGGWAADPDDRASHVNVDIVVDDQTVSSLVAGEFRQDLLDAGVCVDGNCSFSTSLWGAISSYEPHRVDAWAQDDTGEWVLLSNSAKTLTCRSYDIYTFDPATGTTRQITNLRDMHEFNPRWSPDAKKIVHDAWGTDWGSHGVYITDVGTGVSTPLAGADRGSYPTWSPSGKWIAFDRGADEDYRLFILPPAGGTPRLVAEDAFMATWAPNGNRLAFHRPSDGGIWTTDLDGENLTKVAERGNGPAWSPDGEWIAFEVDGDVWKVRVNNSGNPRGEPIQLTGSPLWEGRPTWSFNSKTIAFHAGMGRDTDIWTIPANGGEATWLTGAPNFGDYDANYSIKGQSTAISYASFSPEGQAVRLWVAAYTYDPPVGMFDGGTYPYHFDFEWSVPEAGSWSGQGGEFVISDGADLYDGYVLLRGPEEIRGIKYPDGFACEPTGDINSNQLTRFLIGWLPDYGEIPYSDAKAHFKSITATAVWDEGSAELARHEIIPFNESDWFNYVCTFTEVPLKMNLRVNYGHDWIESFYEAGHEVELTVTESDGVTVKATATVFTEPKDFWGGETGFQTTSEDWIPSLPDLQPYDRVFAQVDNGATAKVQLGDVRGEINLVADGITGTIEAPWITDPVQVECLDWGSGQEPPFSNRDGGFVTTNSVDPYTCSWAGEWDIQPGQTIGVGYFSPDGHWVANAFNAPNPRIVVSEAGDWFWTTEFYPGTLDLFIYESAAEGAGLLWSGQSEADQWGFTIVGSDVHGQDLVPGNYLVVSDGVNEKGVALERITMEVFDTENEIMAGTAPAGREVMVVAGMAETETQATIRLFADSQSGAWMADFSAIPFDITEDMRPWSFAQIFDEDGDANEAGTPPDWFSSLIQAAQQEGSLNVIALPEDWCNYGALIQGFTDNYGIPVNSMAPYASSAEELQAIRDGGPNAPDVIDVGPGFAVQAQSEGLITPYQVATWNTIPDFMKDSEGYWYGDYYGVMAIAANTTQYSQPASWQDLLDGQNVGAVALGGDPRISNMGFFAVYGSALANGGPLDDIGPGLQFFRDINEAGRLLPVIGNGETLASNETPVVLEWSYLALAQRDAYPDALIGLTVPQPGAIGSFYAQAVSAYAPHPNVARLWMEYLYSDASQLAFLQGYCFPARYDDMLARNVIPEDLLARLPDPTGAVFPSLDQIVAAKTYVEENWACTVYDECP